MKTKKLKKSQSSSLRLWLNAVMINWNLLISHQTLLNTIFNHLSGGNLSLSAFKFQVNASLGFNKKRSVMFDNMKFYLHLAIGLPWAWIDLKFILKVGFNDRKVRWKFDAHDMLVQVWRTLYAFFVTVFQVRVL